MRGDMWRLTFIVAALLAAPGLGRSADPAPVALTEGQWLGDDGNWSTTEFMIGSPPQTVNVLVSTSLSEFWAVGPGGCLPKEPHCGAARGGTYDPETSEEWTSMGIWELGMSYLGYGGNGEYGLDSINSHSPITDITFDMDNVLISSINSTDYLLGFFGLGITQGNFGNMVAESPVTQAVKTYGWIPSYSYGYTAGAHYRGVPVSVTLGGYDSSRFKQHDVQFTLPQADGIPRSLVRGIQVATHEGQSKPDDWESDIEILSEWNSSFTAMIDSSTPFLWMPDTLCDRFADALGLTYNSTFDLYTITDDQYQTYGKDESFDFTFSLSSIDNSDEFGSPLDVAGVVNITIPSRALVSQLQYPFMDGAIAYGEPAVPYFSLRKTHNSSTFIIGRSFLQESYLLTKFDEGVFSLHEALFSEEAEIAAIQQPDNSPYPGPPPVDRGLTTGQMAGIAVAVVVSVMLIALAAFFFWRRRRRRQLQQSAAVLEEHKDSSSSLTPETPRTPISRILSKIARRKRSRKPVGGAGGAQNPTEAPDSEIYELPAPIPPVELDGTDDSNSTTGETELGLENAQSSSSYEQARRKMERQLRGPVPEYTPPSNSALPPPEKPIHDMGPAEPHRRVEQPSPVSSPTKSPGSADGNSNSLPAALPSPLSPRGEGSGSGSGSGRWGDGVSSNTDSVPPLPRPTVTSDRGPTSRPASTNAQEPSASRSNSDKSVSPVSPSGESLPPTSATYHRSPIDPSKVVFLGPLPENVQLPGHGSLRRAPERGGAEAPVERAVPGTHRFEDSLGSNFTVDQERMTPDLVRRQSPPLLRSFSHSDLSGSGGRTQGSLETQSQGLRRYQSERSEPSYRGQGRIDPGTELVHVPQVAEKRYSWE